MTRRRRAGAALATAVVAALAAPALAATPGERALVDARGDVAANALDAVAVRFGVGGDRRLRAVVTMSTEWDSSTLRGNDGQTPGSVCVRIYAKADPADAAPDHLACATVGPDGGQLRGELLRNRAHRQPQLIAAATVSRPSHRSITIRFARSAIGAPRTLRFAVDVTMPGCSEASCVDSVPSAPRVARLPAPAGGQD